MQSYKNQPFAIRCRFALQGLAAALRSEHSLRYQIVALVCVIVVLIGFRLEPLWWAIIAFTSAAVITAELFNTALEFLADHLHPQTHPQIRLVKDCAAAAVLVAAVGALAVAVAVAVHLLNRA